MPTCSFSTDTELFPPSLSFKQLDKEEKSCYTKIAHYIMERCHEHLTSLSNNKELEKDHKFVIIFKQLPKLEYLNQQINEFENKSESEPKKWAMDLRQCISSITSNNETLIELKQKAQSYNLQLEKLIRLQNATAITTQIDQYETNIQQLSQRINEASNNLNKAILYLKTLLSSKEDFLLKEEAKELVSLIENSWEELKSLSNPEILCIEIRDTPLSPTTPTLYKTDSTTRSLFLFQEQFEKNNIKFDIEIQHFNTSIIWESPDAKTNQTKTNQTMCLSSSIGTIDEIYEGLEVEVNPKKQQDDGKTSSRCEDIVQLAISKVKDQWNEVKLTKSLNALVISKQDIAKGPKVNQKSKNSNSYSLKKLLSSFF